MLFLHIFLATFFSNAKGDGEVSTKLGSTIIHLSWNVDYQDQSVLFIVNQALRPLSYLIIGFSDHGSYNNSDICIYQGGKLRDGYIDGEFQIQFDRSQDCQLEKKQGSRFLFRRRFATCDPRDFAFEEGTTQFIIAGGYEFTRDFSSNSVMKVLRYGLLIDLDDSIANSMESDGTRFKILASDAVIPETVTTYWCVIERIPSVLSKRKHHIIQINPHIKKGNENLVHHMEIFRCETGYEFEYSGNCDGLTMSPTARSCSHVIAAWAMGEGPIYFPPEAGLPLGGESDRRYIKVEIHYNNPGLLSGVVDNSGFELVVTTELREFDAGILEIGLIYSDANSIPPGQSAFPLTGYCVADCTSRLPPGGIHIFGSQLHAHLSGRKIFTSHYRHGVKIGEINRDNHYSPHWQHIVFIRPYIHVMPGDVLSTTCVYETLSKNVMTLGGYGIDDEMCVNYIYYFPASNVEVCKSAIDNTTLHSYFEHEHHISNWDLPIHEKYESIEWNDKNAASLNELYSVAPLNMHCFRNDGSLFPNHPTNWTAVPLPRVFTAPYGKIRDKYDCPALND